MSHLYNLRRSSGYRRINGPFLQHTRATAIPIGERRKPNPQGEPGYLRVDSVHQGDFEGVKGVYLINAVDEITQYEFVGAVARSSEVFLLPVLGSMLEVFPFVIRGFYSHRRAASRASEAPHAARPWITLALHLKFALSSNLLNPI